MSKFALSAVGLMLMAGFIACASIDWPQFKQLHGKQYADPIEDRMRNEIFARNKLQVDKFNAEESEKLGYKRGLNHLCDRTEEEIKGLLGLRIPEGLNRTNSAEGEAFLANILAKDFASGPSGRSVDWRQQQGIVTPVKNQGQCGSCWAFSAVGALEGQELKQTRRQQLIGLSEQNLMDCTISLYDQGCNGGLSADAIDQVGREGGIQSEASYPYQERDGNGCKFDKRRSIMTARGHSMLRQGDEEQLGQVVANFGPVSVGIDASHMSFQTYRSGVYKEAACSSSALDHGVLVVGYGTDPQGGDYWLVKNSWGEGWGENGYIRMARGGNMCGIATYAVIPTF